MINKIGKNATNLTSFVESQIVKLTPVVKKQQNIPSAYTYKDKAGNVFTSEAYKRIKNIRRTNKRKENLVVEGKATIENGQFSLITNFMKKKLGVHVLTITEKLGLTGAYSLNETEKKFLSVLTKVDNFNYLSRQGKYNVLRNLSKPVTKRGDFSVDKTAGLNIDGGLWSKRNNKGFKEMLETAVTIQLNMENGLPKGKFCSENEAKSMAESLERWHVSSTDFASIYGSDVI